MSTNQTLNFNFIKLNQILYFNLKIKLKIRKKEISKK